MPIIESSFRPPRFLSQADMQTVLPYFVRRPPPFRGKRERLELDDGDFIDIDFTRGGHNRIAILSHGLEGSSSSKYILGMSATFQRRGWDTAAWNFRGCSGTPNRLQTGYHSGKWDDLERVVEHALHGGYRSVALVGYSVGGNITLLYLGRAARIPKEVIGSAVVCAPCDLAASAAAMATRRNTIYMRWFLRLLREKLLLKGLLEVGSAQDSELRTFRTFYDFDSRYTAPMFDFESAEAYWAQASSRPDIPKVQVPTLMLTPRNDPFLADACFPIEEAKNSTLVHLEMPPSGGHVGFFTGLQGGEYWSERRIVEFLESQYRLL